MNDKIALVSCSGLSPLGLVVRAASVELALENENIVAACITEYSAQPNNCSPILDDAKIVTITGCGDDCASVILKDKNIAAVKNISLDHVVKAYDLNPLDAVRFRGELMSVQMIHFVGKCYRMLGKLVTVKYVHTCKGDLMAMGTFVDCTGEVFDTVHFPMSLKTYPFQGDGVYLLFGKVTEEFGQTTLEVEKMAKMGYRQRE